MSQEGFCFCRTSSIMFWFSSTKPPLVLVLGLDCQSKGSNEREDW